MLAVLFKSHFWFKKHTYAIFLALTAKDNILVGKHRIVLKGIVYQIQWILLRYAMLKSLAVSLFLPALLQYSGSRWNIVKCSGLCRPPIWSIGVNLSQIHPRTDFHLQFHPHFGSCFWQMTLGIHYSLTLSCSAKERRPAVLAPLRKTFSCWCEVGTRAQMDSSINGIDINLSAESS